MTHSECIELQYAIIVMCDLVGVDGIEERVPGIEKILQWRTCVSIGNTLSFRCSELRMKIVADRYWKKQKRED